MAPGAFPADLQKVADGLPKLGGEYVPGNFVPVQREQLLSANPDLVIGGWPSNFDTTKGALSQAELTERRLNSYYAYSVVCERDAPVTDLSFVYKDIENYGKMFGDTGWEEVVDRNPDVVVIEVFGKGTQAEFDQVVAEAEAFFTSDRLFLDFHHAGAMRTVEFTVSTKTGPTTLPTTDPPDGGHGH